MSCVCQVWCFVLDKPLEVNRYGHRQGPSCRGRGEIQELKRYSKYRRWEAEFIIHWSTLVPPVRNSGIIVNITTILFYEIGPIFRSRHECQLWDRMEDYQGQLLLPSQEEGWVASRWFYLNFSNVEIQVSVAAYNQGFVVTTKRVKLSHKPFKTTPAVAIMAGLGRSLHKVQVEAGKKYSPGHLFSAILATASHSRMSCKNVP